MISENVAASIRARAQEERFANLEAAFYAIARVAISASDGFQAVMLADALQMKFGDDGKITPTELRIIKVGARATTRYEPLTREERMQG